MNATEVREEVLSWMQCIPKFPVFPSAVERGMLTGLLNRTLQMGRYEIKVATVFRHQVLAWLFRDALGKPNASGISSKELTDEMWWGLAKFIDMHKDADTGQWVGRPDLAECILKCYHAMVAWQAEMDNQLGFNI